MSIGQTSTHPVTHSGAGARFSFRPWAAPFVRQLLRRLAVGRLVVHLPSGEILSHDTQVPGPQAVIVLHRWRAMRRLLSEGDLGLAEAYIAGDWSTPDLMTVIELGARNEAALGAALTGSWPARMASRLAHLMRPNSRGGSRRNIPAHYDLGNAFYAAWLDRGMSYSSALYTPATRTLEEAQVAKQDRVMEWLDVQPGHEVLEIGCGWGGLAERLVTENECWLTGLTLSPAQLEHAKARMREAGIDAQTDLRLQDYRDIEGQFDRIVSIEMLEAVGTAYWPTYFEKIRALLKPGGVSVLQVISIDEARYAAYRQGADFIQRHVFPGGMLPSIGVMREQIGRAGLALTRLETFGASYARTLAEWGGRFQATWPALSTKGFDEKFRRKWEYYLAYCEAGFRTGAIDVGFYRLEHAG
ncbi:class I SAM-dependent methyltransferase [Roseococcus sp.]|uniref:class I SAM-dependent methyltransferase n=1 Tax=Roseococcus sp. TaxID=2109646 RepID=UPI003BAC8B5D